MGHLATSNVYTSIYERVVNGPVLHLLKMCLHGHGLVRSKCKHIGLFFIVGTRHSKQSKKTMGQTDPQLHDYSDATNANLSLLPLVKSTINLLSYQAQRMRMSCGEITTAVIEKALQNYPEDFHLDLNKKWSIIT